MSYCPRGCPYYARRAIDGKTYTQSKTDFNYNRWWSARFDSAVVKSVSVKGFFETDSGYKFPARITLRSNYGSAKYCEASTSTYIATVSCDWETGWLSDMVELLPSNTSVMASLVVFEVSVLGGEIEEEEEEEKFKINPTESKLVYYLIWLVPNLI